MIQVYTMFQRYNTNNHGQTGNKISCLTTTWKWLSWFIEKTLVLFYPMQCLRVIL